MGAWVNVAVSHPYLIPRNTLIYGHVLACVTYIEILLAIPLFLTSQAVKRLKTLVKANDASIVVFAIAMWIFMFSFFFAWQALLVSLGLMSDWLSNTPLWGIGPADNPETRFYIIALFLVSLAYLLIIANLIILILWCRTNTGFTLDELIILVGCLFLLLILYPQLITTLLSLISSKT